MPASINPALAAALPADGACRICGGAIDAGSLSCGNCGAAYGEQNRCPHCRNVAGVERHKVLEFRCRICGGPRVPLDSPDAPRSGREVPELARAQRARFRTAAWRIGAGVVGSFGVVSLLVAVLVVLAASPGVLGSIGLLAAVATPLLLAAWAWSKAKQSASERDAALEDAWLFVASDAMRALGAGVDASTLARLLRSEERRAEQLLAELSAKNLVHARVTDAGDVLFTPGQPRLRVDHAAGAQQPLEDAPGTETARPTLRARTPR